MKTMIGKGIFSDPKVGGDELRFIGTRIAVSDALETVADGYSFEETSKQYHYRIPPEAIAEAVELAAKFFADEYPRRKHSLRPARKNTTI